MHNNTCNMRLRSRQNATLWLMLIIVTTLTPTVLSAAHGSGRLKSGQKRAFDQSTQNEDGASSQKRLCDPIQSNDGNIELSSTEPFHTDDASEADISDAEKQDVKTSQSVGSIVISDDQLAQLGQHIFNQYSWWGKTHFCMLYELVCNVEDDHRFQNHDDRGSPESRRRAFQRSSLTDTVVASKLDEGVPDLYMLLQYEKEFRDNTGFSVEVNACNEHIYQQVKKANKVNLNKWATMHGAIIELATETLSLIRSCRHKLEQMVSDNFGIDPIRVTAFIVEQITMAQRENPSTDEAGSSVDVEVNDENTPDSAAQTMEMDQ